MKKIYKIVLMPIDVPFGKYCWQKYVCPHFDNEDGYPTCDYNLGDLKYNKKGHVLKPEKCLNLKIQKEKTR